MKITRKNYEEWLIDWLDGSLTVEQIDELRLFLRKNPDLKEEFSGVDKVRLNPDKLPNIDFSALKKSVFDQPDVFEDTCIRSVEHTLSSDEEIRLQTYLQSNPKAAHEYELFKATVLKPDETICYSDISSLRLSPGLPVYIYRVAAAVVLLISFFWWQQNDVSTLKMPEKHTVALTEKPQPSLITTNYKPKLLALAEPVQVNELQTVETISPREDFSDMQLLASKTISISASEASYEIIEIDIKNNNTSTPNQEERYPTIGEYLAERIDIEKGKNKLATFALNKIKGATNDKIDYSTTQQGEIDKIEFSTRILAFSIPVD
ncbi:MAG: hypothetical protein PF436_12175 [Prolixibacteraceae bacterium]|jgi:hypothetical protein|nr:hypothetical protein [Prolixibacteraceae bacterium]